MKQSRLRLYSGMLDRDDYLIMELRNSMQERDKKEIVKSVIAFLFLCIFIMAMFFIGYGIDNSIQMKGQQNAKDTKILEKVIP